MAMVETLPPPSRPASRPTAQAAPPSRPPQARPQQQPEQAKPSPVAEAVYATRATAEQILELVQPGGGEGPNPLEALADTLESILLGQRQIQVALKDLTNQVEALRRGR